MAPDYFADSCERLLRLISIQAVASFYSLYDQDHQQRSSAYQSTQSRLVYRSGNGCVRVAQRPSLHHYIGQSWRIRTARRSQATVIAPFISSSAYNPATVNKSIREKRHRCLAEIRLASTGFWIVLSLSPLLTSSMASTTISRVIPMTTAIKEYFFLKI
ncbi:MAG: hypothetical protein JSC189_000538 [Candidatus Tokpelaia sp. JSC189]|nr:MAG: hypothetical protein JSC189_000538 [Candidatus Tokpelaia sp. JSC189]